MNKMKPEHKEAIKCLIRSLQGTDAKPFVTTYTEAVKGHVERNDNPTLNHILQHTFFNNVERMIANDILGMLDSQVRNRIIADLHRYLTQEEITATMVIIMDEFRAEETNEVYKLVMDTSEYDDEVLTNVAKAKRMMDTIVSKKQFADEIVLQDGLLSAIDIAMTGNLEMQAKLINLVMGTNISLEKECATDDILEITYK